MLQQRFIRLPRRTKQVLAMSLDVATLAFVVWLASVLRTGELWPLVLAERWWLLLVVPVIGIPVFRLVRLYRTVVRHLGTTFAGALIVGVSITASLMLVMVLLRGGTPAFPLTSIGIFWALAIVGVGGTRLTARVWFRSGSPGARRSVIIYGAGDAGAQLQNAISNSNRHRLVGFVDDNPSCWKTVVNGTNVHDPASIGHLVEKHDCQDIFIAIPSSSLTQRREIIDRLRPLPVMVRTVPSLTELVEGRVTLEAIRPISIEDLLGRDTVEPRQELLDRCIRDQVVMVSGAGGSIGSELCRQIIKLGPSRIILFEQSEFALYAIAQELTETLDLK